MNELNYVPKKTTEITSEINKIMRKEKRFFLALENVNKAYRSLTFFKTPNFLPEQLNFPLYLSGINYKL